MDSAEFAGIPGIDLEPLDPFYDDVFAGMDEHPTGPWPHQLLAPAELHEQQQLDCHFPAIDCDLLEEQLQAAAEPAVDTYEQHHSFGHAVSILPGAETAQVQHQQSEQLGSSSQGLGHLYAAVTATTLPDEQDVGPAPTHMAASAGSMLASCHAAPADAVIAPAGLLCTPITNTSSSAHAELLQSTHGVAGEQSQGDVADAVCAPQQEDSNDGSQDLTSSIQDAAATPSQDCAQMHSAGTGHALVSSSADLTSKANEPVDSSAAVDDNAGVDGVGNSTAAASLSAGEMPPVSHTSEQAGGAAAPAAAAEGETSSGSLPDIDDVPEEQVDPQQQQPAVVQERALLYWDEAEQSQQQQQPHSQHCAQEQAVPELQGATDAQPQQQPAGQSSGSSGCVIEHAVAAMEGPATEQQQVSGFTPASCSTDEQLTAAQAAALSSTGFISIPGNNSHTGDSGAAEDGAVGVVPAAAAASVHQDAEQQQMSAHGDMFASPCSSWHSCVTAVSKASSMNSSRAFFLQHPAAGAAAHACATSSATHGAAVRDSLNPQHEQHHEVQQQSRADVCPPAMVSSLHLALQQHEQQRRSQHSHQSAHSLAAEEPATTAAVEHPGCDVTLCPATTQQDGVTESACAAGGCSSITQPIAVQQQHPQQHPQKDELWQDVSPPSFSTPPSFSSSLGVLVSAVSAGTAAAEAQEESQQGTEAPAAPAADAYAAEATGLSMSPEQHDSLSPAAAAAAAAAEAAETIEEASEQHDGEDVFADDDVGHGHFYAEAAGLSMSPDQHGNLLQRPGLGHPQHQQHHLANSSYVLRHSELVDLSLSTSVHPGLLLQQQQVHPGWLTAHQQLPPAAAQAVERAVVALNDSYYSPGRNSPSEVLGSAATGPIGAGVGGARSMGVAAMGAVGGAIRRSGAGRQWNRAHTHPQQDQQARHSLPSQAPHSGPAGPFSWPGAAVLGDWFSSTVQHPLAAAAGRAAVGVVQRMGMAPGTHTQQQQAAGARQHSSSRGAVPPHAAAGSNFAGASSGSSSSSGAGGAPNMGSAAEHGAVPGSAGMAPRVGDERGMEDGFGAEDAVLIEKTSDLPQSLQEQEDEAFRGLLFLGGRDSQGRPVVIVNTDAIPAGHNAAPRDAALAYLLMRLSPIVTRGPYVLVVVALHHGPQFRLLPGVWCVRAYQSLPRAFRKNVKHVILLQPSMLVKTAMALLYPFVSSKAHAKVKQVQRLLDIDAATCGEVQVPHLGEAFLTTVHHINGSRARQADS